MAATYPDNIKTFTNPIAGDTLNNPSHSTQHTAENDEITAVETALGVNLGNVVLSNGTVNPTNLLSNGNFESWSEGTSAGPDGWILSGTGAAVAQEATIIKIGTYSVKLTKGSASSHVYQEAHATRGIEYWKGRAVTFSGWVWCDTANNVKLRLSESTTTGDDEYSSYHTGGSGWEYLSVTSTLSSAATRLRVSICMSDSAGSSYLDGAILVEGSSAFAFSPKPAEEGVWAQYAAVSTIVGWTSFSYKQIYTKKIGKTVFVNFYIGGTSDNATTTFTLPYVNASGLSARSFLSATYDAGSLLTTPGRTTMENSSNLVTCYKDCGTGAFTNSGDKRVRGQFFYESA